MDASSRTAMRWVWRGSALGALLIGWCFVLFHNNFHVTTPVVFVMLGYLAAVSAIYALFKTGASAVVAADDDDDRDEATWGLSVARDELEREKRTLLKAIKEAEFDHQMGKLSKRDVDEMIRNYRLRAIEVIKLLDEGKQAGTLTVRDQIRREVRARLEIDAVRAKVERAHADLSARKHKQQAAAAAQQAARAAAAAGASAHQVREIAAEAARRADEEEEARLRAEAGDEGTAAKAAKAADDAKADDANAKADDANAKAADDAKAEKAADDAKAEKAADDVKDAKAADDAKAAKAAETPTDAPPAEAAAPAAKEATR